MGEITTGKFTGAFIGDNAIGLQHMAHGNNGRYLGWDTTGVPTALDAPSTGGGLQTSDIHAWALATSTASIPVDKIPDLNANKITAGTFNADRIPNLNANKVNAGIFNIARIPDLNANKITAGTFPTERLGDDTVTLAKIEHNNPNNYMGWDATGAPVALNPPPTSTAPATNPTFVKYDIDTGQQILAATGAYSDLTFDETPNFVLENAGSQVSAASDELTVKAGTWLIEVQIPITGVSGNNPRKAAGSPD